MKKRTMLAFGMGSVGNNLIYGLMTSFLLLFYTDYLGITAAAAGIIIVAAKVWDAMNDTVMGIVVDNTQTRFGRFRPYLLVAPIFMAIATVLCFTVPDVSYTWKIVYASITYVLWGMSFTAMDIPYWSMTATLTRDSNERSKVVAISRAFATLANIVAVVAVIPLVNLLGGDNQVIGWRRMAMVFGALAIVFTWITFFNVKEKFQVKNNERQTIKKFIGQLKVNDALRAIIISMFFYEMAFAFKFSFLQYYIKYNFSESMIPIIMGCVAVGSVVGAIIAPILGDRLSKKKIIKVSVGIQSFLGVVLFLGGYKNLNFIIIVNSLLAICDGICLILFYTLITNTVEYGQYKTGERREGATFSLNILKTKIAGAIGIGMGALSLQALGFVANEVQSTATLNGIHTLFTIVPAILVLLVYIPIRKYTITEEGYQEILKALSLNN